MALRDDIAAIHADASLTEDARRAALYTLKVSALVSRLSGFVGQSWTLDGVTYRLNGIAQGRTESATVLVVDLTRTAEGRIFDDSDVLSLVNPPLSKDGKAIDEMTKAERLAFLRALLGVLPGGEGA